MNHKIVYAAAIFLSGCVDMPSSQENIHRSLAELNLTTGKSADEIQYREFDDWEYIDQYHIIIETEHIGKFLASFERRCRTLSKNSYVTFEHTPQKLTKHSSLEVHSPITKSATYCYFQDIVRLNESK